MPTIVFDQTITRSDPAVRALNAFRRAEVETSSVLRSTLACDSADAVYAAALSAVGVDTTDLVRHPGALRAAWQTRQNGGARRSVAMDSAAISDREKRFPHAGRLGFGA